ncbi:MAG: carbohydrate ABC transporter permease [Nitrososphaerota archaeon]
MSKEYRKIKTKLMIIIAAILLILWITIPLYWAFKTSISYPEEAWNPGLPTKVTFENYIQLFNPYPFAKRYAIGAEAALPQPVIVPIKNSFIVAIIAATISTIMGMFAGYNLARFHYKGKRLAMYYILFTYIFPTFMLAIPLMIILKQIGLLNTLQGLIFVHLAYTLPYSILMLRSYFMEIPIELEESALIDGCTRSSSFLRITLPLSAPGLVTSFVFAFTLSWNDLLFALILLSSTELYTLPLEMNFFLWGGEIVDPIGLSTVAVFTGIIPVILYMVLQKYIIIGLVRGALKR